MKKKGKTDDKKGDAKDPGAEQDKLMKKPVGRPKKKKETEDEKRQRIYHEQEEALKKCKKKSQADDDRKKKEAEEKRKADEKAAREAQIKAKKDMLGKGTKICKEPAMKGKSMKKAVEAAWRYKDPISHSTSDDEDIEVSPAKPSPRCKKPIGTYNSDDDDDDFVVSKTSKPTRLAFDTPEKGRRKARKQPTPTKVATCRQKLFYTDDEDDESNTVPETDPEFADINTALQKDPSSKPLPPSTPDAQQKILSGAQTQAKVTALLKSMQENLGNLPAEKTSEVQSSIKILEDELGEVSNDTDLTSREFEFTMKYLEKRTLKLQKQFQGLESSSTSKSAAGSGVTSSAAASGVMSSDCNLINEKVKAAMDFIKVDDNYDPSMEKAYEDALTKFYSGDQSDEGTSTQPDDSKEDKTKKTTRDVLLHLLSQIVGSANVQFFNDMTSHVSKKTSSKKVASKKLKVVEDPLRSSIQQSEPQEQSVENTVPYTDGKEGTTFDSSVPSTPNSTSTELTVEEKVKSAMEVWKNHPTFDASMQGRAEEAFRKFYSGEQASTDGSSTKSDGSDKDDKKKRNTADVLLQALSQILGGGNEEFLKAIMDHVSNKKTEKKVQQKKLQVAKDPLLETQPMSLTPPRDEITDNSTSTPTPMMPKQDTFTDVLKRVIPSVFNEYSKLTDNNLLSNSQFSCDYLDYLQFCDSQNLDPFKIPVYYPGFETFRKVKETRTSVEAEQAVQMYVRNCINVEEEEVSTLENKVFDCVVDLINNYDDFVGYLPSSSKKTSATRDLNKAQLFCPQLQATAHEDTPMLSLSDDETPDLPSTGELVQDMEVFEHDIDLPHLDIGTMELDNLEPEEPCVPPLSGEVNAT